MTISSLKQIRQEGIGSNFKVLNPVDGFRQDNSIWFGVCDTCGAQVHNSSRDGIWMHNLILDTTYHTTGEILSQTIESIDYCPEVTE